MDIVDIETKKPYQIDLKRSSGEETLKCPACNDERKKKNLKPFSWNHEKDIGFCNHCEIKFGKVLEAEDKIEYKKPVSNGTALQDRALTWFKSRGISEDVINRFNITQYQNGCTWIKFNYFEGAELVNVKSRNSKKEFRLEPG